MLKEAALTGSTALARILKLEGTEVLFCFPPADIIEAAASEGIRVVTARTERTVVGMADGYTRMLNGRRIGVCGVQQGPGIENAFVGVAQAWNDSSPILLIPGGPALDRIGLPDLFDSPLHYRGVTKWTATINSAARVPAIAARAFTKLRNGRRRPVLLELPRDVARQPLDEAELRYEPARSHPSAGAPADVEEAVRLVSAAEKPVLLAGQGVLWAEATAELIELVELLRLPVLTTLLGKSAFPEDHPLALGVGSTNSTGPADRYLKEADLVLCVGASFNRTLASVIVPPGKTIVHCTSDVDDLNTEYRTRCAVVGDAKLVLQQLAAEVRKRPPRRADPAAEVKGLRDEWYAQWMPTLTSEEVPINPYRIVWELVQMIDPHRTVATHDSGTPRGQLAVYYPATVPRSYLGWGNSHQLGSSLGLIMGAKLAAPDKLAIAFMGDAAFGMCGLDLETAVRERIPILAIVLNNSVMGSYGGVIPVAMERYQAGRISGDYAAVAKGLGCYAERVERPDEIVAALQRGIAATEAGRPAVLEFMTREEGLGSRPGMTAPE